MTAPLERRAPSGSDGKSSVAGDSTVTQDYLKVVWAACEWGGAGASVTGLAKRMEVAPSTASENVARLVEEGLLVHEPYKAVTLSEEGRRRAMGMIRRHRILETYLVTQLGFGWDEVHAEAEELEHAVSERLLERLDTVLGHPTRARTGTRSLRRTDGSSYPDLVRLETMPVGSDGVVGRIQDDTETLRRPQEGRASGWTGRVRIRDRGTVAPAEEGGKRRRATVITLLDPEASHGAVPEMTPEAIIPDGSLWLLA